VLSARARGTEVAMLSSLFESSTIPVLEKVVKFTEARHGVLAGNIANLDTPGYKTRDLSPALFQERLKEAIEARHQPPSPGYELDAFGSAPTYKSSRRAERQLTAFRKVEESMKSILRHDEADVSMEQQINEIVKNQQQHNLAINIMSAQFRLLRAAITERVA
jgi:flagellar basal-body rod protein FlgB